MKDYALSNMRDCVLDAYKNGSKRGQEFEVMRHAIIAELLRLGYGISEIKDKLLDWNARCDKSLLPNEQKRQLLDYVDWAVKNNGKTGCKALEGFCIGKKKCEYNNGKEFFNRELTKEMPFDIDEAKKFLEERYKADGNNMMLVLKSLRKHQQQKATGEIIYIGYRGIASLIRDVDGHIVTPMTIYRAMQRLISEGMVEIISRGARGSFRAKANGYRFREWRRDAYNT